MSGQDIESILLPLGKETQGFNTPQTLSRRIDSGELRIEKLPKKVMFNEGLHTT